MIPVFFFFGLNLNDISRLSQTPTNEGSNVENVPLVKLDNRIATSLYCRPDVVIPVGVHAEMSLTLSPDSFCFCGCGF